MSDLDLIVVEKGNPDEQTDMERAAWVLRTLNDHYPHHPWTVAVQGRGLIIRHLMISGVAAGFLKREGFSFLMPRDKMTTPKEVAESAMRAGGAMLELFGLRRGACDGTMPEIPKDWKARQQRKFG
jgi:hypothetical protein